MGTVVEKEQKLCISEEILTYGNRLREIYVSMMNLDAYLASLFDRVKKN